MVRTSLLALLIWGYLAANAPVANAQCAVTMSVPLTLGTFRRVTKTLSMVGNCVTTKSMAAGCGRAPAATMATMLIATALTGVSPAPFYCSWVCDCGSGFTNVMVRTGGSDGLPVELLDFKVSALDSSLPSFPPVAPVSETPPDS